MSLFVITNSFNVFAAENTRQSNSQNVIRINAQEVTEYTGKSIQEVLGCMPSRASSMPSSTWDWNNGSYSGSFEISYMYSYTRYNFTGYSRYYVESKASRDIWTAASDKYTIYLMTGTGQGTIATSYTVDSTDWVTIEFYNLDPGTKYAVCFSKANDGSTLSGGFYISTEL
ncbi:MAG: hypothetical protein ACI4EJ_10070 [Bacteroides sp.]